MTSPEGPGPLLIACALGIEKFALGAAAPRARTRPGAVDGGPEVLRTGMGPQAASAVLGRALQAEPVPGATAVLATGFCAGLVHGLRPGDLVVAEETRDEEGSTPCVGAGVLARALAPYGTVHTGILAGSPRVVRGPAARGALHDATGAMAADMESAAVLRTATAAVHPAPLHREQPVHHAQSAAPQAPQAAREQPAAAAPAARPVPPKRHEHPADPVRRASAAPRPVAAVRVVVDAPGHELVRMGTLRGGISAFRVLRGILPAFLEWHRTLLLPRR